MTNVARTTTVRGGAALLAVGLLMAGCGGTTKAASGPTTTSGHTASAMHGATTTVPAVSTGSGTNPGSSFCQQAKLESSEETTKAEEAFAKDTPAELKQFETQALALLPEYVAAAPSQIKAAVETAVAVDKTIYNDLSAVGFNYAKIGSDKSIEAAVESPAFINAGNTIAHYLDTVCGETIPTTPITS